MGEIASKDVLIVRKLTDNRLEMRTYAPLYILNRTQEPINVIQLDTTTTLGDGEGIQLYTDENSRNRFSLEKA